MFTKKSAFRMLSVLLIVLMTSSAASARPLNAALGTGFTYQGQLTDGGAPANGAYDFEFELFDALSGGSLVGGTVTQGGVTVTNGLFTVQLDFGNVFDGTALFLNIGVKPGGSVEAYTPLTPRQALTATPYAIYASKAPWSGLTGVPAGFADGVDDNTTYTAGDGLELVGTQFKGKGTAYQNVVIVAKSGGDFTTITAALTSITTASDTNRYLIYVAPGVYTERVTMKQFVDIEGAGELTTKITFIGDASVVTGTVVGANDAELRFLTVENTGGAAYAVAIFNSGAAPRLTHVSASASGGTGSYGVYNYDSSSPTMTDVSASASGETYSYGVVNFSSSSPTMTDVSASASGGTQSYGVYNDDFSSPIINNSVIRASDGTGYNRGIYNSASSPIINNSVIRASGGLSTYGIDNTASSGTYTVLVNNSQVSGGTNTIRNDSGFTTRVGASQLDGGAVDGVVTCAGVYDENYAFYASTCP